MCGGAACISRGPRGAQPFLSPLLVLSLSWITNILWPKGTVSDGGPGTVKRNAEQPERAELLCVPGPRVVPRLPQAWPLVTDPRGALRPWPHENKTMLRPKPSEDSCWVALSSELRLCPYQASRDRGEPLPQAQLIPPGRASSHHPRKVGQGLGLGSGLCQPPSLACRAQSYDKWVTQSLWSPSPSSKCGCPGCPALPCTS